MQSFKDLDRLVELIIRHRLPKEQIIFQEIEEYNKTMGFLKNLGSSGVQPAVLPNSNPELECVTINYCGIIFRIVNF